MVAAALEDQPVLRVEPDQLDLVLEPAPHAGEDLGEDAGIEEEGRAEVEAVAVRRRQRAGAAADDLVLLEHRDLRALRRQQHGGGEPARPRADDGDAGTGGLQGGGGERGVHARRRVLHSVKDGVICSRQMRPGAPSASVLQRNKAAPGRARPAGCGRTATPSAISGRGHQREEANTQLNEVHRQQGTYCFFARRRPGSSPPRPAEERCQSRDDDHQQVDKRELVLDPEQDQEQHAAQGVGRDQDQALVWRSTKTPATAPKRTAGPGS